MGQYPTSIIMQGRQISVYIYIWMKHMEIEWLGLCILRGYAPLTSQFKGEPQRLYFSGECTQIEVVSKICPSL